jgi:hypothetical protein
MPKLPKLPEKFSKALKNLIPDIPEEKTAKIKDSAFAAKDFVYENLIIFIIGAVCIVIVLIIAVLAAMNWGGMKTRVVTVSEISGDAHFVRDARQYTVVKNASIQTGDVITVEEGGRVRIKLDPDKYLIIEENSSLYIDFTDVQSKGAISVNLLYGSVISRLDNPIGERDLFVVVTPNGTAETKTAVFRTTFTYYEEYAEGLPAKITDVEDFSGNIVLQLYDDNREKSGVPMIQTEKTTTRLITTPGVTQFSALNLPLDLTKLPETSLAEVLRIAGERKTGYELSELNSALKAVVAMNYPTATVPTLPTDIDTEQIIITAKTEPPPPTQATMSTEETTVITTTEPVIETVPTTAQTFGEYTQYTGEKWWLDFPENTSSETTQNDDY